MRMRVVLTRRTALSRINVCLCAVCAVAVWFCLVRFVPQPCGGGSSGGGGAGASFGTFVRFVFCALARDATRLKDTRAVHDDDDRRVRSCGTRAGIRATRNE